MQINTQTNIYRILGTNMGKNILSLKFFSYALLKNLTRKKYFLLVIIERQKRIGGYNLNGGGDRPLMLEQTKKKMSESKLGEKNYWYGKHLSDEHKANLREKHLGLKHSEEAKKKMSDQRKGEGNGMFGKTQSEKTKKVIGDKNKGRTPSKETREKMGESHRGEKNYWFNKPFPEEMRKNMSDAQKGEKSHNFGKKFSDEHKKKMSESSKLAWLKRKQKVNPNPNHQKRV
jgi:hypothetical protein